MQHLIPATVAFIQEAHAGQKYGNMPYFFHPVEVAEMAENLLVNGDFGHVHANVRDVVLAALLHDVIEDTEYTEADLRERFSPVVVDAVVLLTKDDNFDYRANIQRIVDSGNYVAMVVKLADNLVNNSGDKSAMAPARAAKLTERYTMSIGMLQQALNG